MSDLARELIDLAAIVSASKEGDAYSLAVHARDAIRRGELAPLEEAYGRAMLIDLLHALELVENHERVRGITKGPPLRDDDIAHLLFTAARKLAIADELQARGEEEEEEEGGEAFVASAHFPKHIQGAIRKAAVEGRVRKRGSGKAVRYSLDDVLANANWREAIETHRRQTEELALSVRGICVTGARSALPLRNQPPAR